MRSITVRNLDDHLWKRLRARVAEHGRSTEEEVRFIPRQAVFKDGSGSRNLAASTREWFAPLGGMERELPPRGPMREPPDFSGTASSAGARHECGISSYGAQAGIHCPYRRGLSGMRQWVDMAIPLASCQWGVRRATARMTSNDVSERRLTAVFPARSSEAFVVRPAAGAGWLPVQCEDSYYARIGTICPV